MVDNHKIVLEGLQEGCPYLYAKFHTDRLIENCTIDRQNCANRKKTSPFLKNSLKSGNYFFRIFSSQASCHMSKLCFVKNLGRFIDLLRLSNSECK